MKRCINALLLVAFLAASCVLPNKYEATATVEKDACQVDYKGQFLVLAALNKNVPPEQARAGTIDAMKRFEAELMTQGGTIKTNLIGPGLFEATVAMKQLIEKNPKPVLNLFTIQKDEQGKVTLKTMEANEREKKAFPEAGIEGKGELTVITKGKVLEENAQDKPGWWAKWIPSGYVWKLDYVNGTPATMVIQF